MSWGHARRLKMHHVVHFAAKPLQLKRRYVSHFAAVALLTCGEVNSLCVLGPAH